MNLFFKKKQIKGYPKSFAKRLTWRIMLRMIIIMGIPMVVVFWLIFGMEPSVSASSKVRERR